MSNDITPPAFLDPQSGETYVVDGNDIEAGTPDEDDLPLYSITELAVLAHRLWTYWSQHIAEEEDISQERYERWQDLWVPFGELDEEMQGKDRELVERFIDETPDYSNNGTKGDAQSN